MAQYLKKRDARHRDMINSYFTMLNEVEKFRDQETSAALIIQKDWRMLKVKWKFSDKKNASLRI